MEPNLFLAIFLLQCGENCRLFLGKMLTYTTFCMQPQTSQHAQAGTSALDYLLNENVVFLGM